MTLAFGLSLCCCVRKKSVTHAHVDAHTQADTVSMTTSEAPAYEEIPGLRSRYTTPRRWAQRDVSETGSTYEELFPVYEDLDSYADTYLALNGYTYLELTQHARDDVTRRDIARSVGPIYLTLLNQYERCPKAYEETQLRLRALVREAWQDMKEAGRDTKQTGQDTKKACPDTREA